MRPSQFIFPAADVAAICASQTLGGAGALILNGTLVDLASAALGIPRVVLPKIQRTVSLQSGGNLSGVNFTITGFDVRGVAISEVRAGPNANTVETTAQFWTITGVSANGAVASAVQVGTGSVGSTRWWLTDRDKNPVNMSIACVLTATANWTVQDTPDNANDLSVTPSTFNHPVLAALTASAESNYAFPPRFVRGVMNSSSGSGACTMTIIQAG